MNMRRKFDRIALHSASARMAKFLPTIACLFLMGVGTVANAAGLRFINSFPHVENFDANSYSDLLWLTEGGTHTWMPNGGWRGGAAKFTGPLAQGYTGLGQFMLNMTPKPEQFNVRFLLYHGLTWHQYGAGGKLIIMNRSGNRGRPMVIAQDFRMPDGRTWETIGPCDGTVCKYDPGELWPDGNDRFKIGNGTTLGRAGEWISVEFEANTRTGMIRLYIDTLDGALSGLYIEQPMIDTGPGGEWAYIDVIGGYMNWGSVQQHPENYFMFDELVLDSRFIGPPAGFGAARPLPPAVQVR